MKSFVSGLKSLLRPHPPGNQQPAPGADSQVMAANGELERIECQVNTLLQQGHQAEALRVAKQARAEAPDAPGRAYLQGLSLEYMGRHQEAMEAYRAELALNPNHPHALSRCRLWTAALASPGSDPDAATRSWCTSLPRPTLQAIQRAIHHYEYRGVPLLKDPFDLALYPRLLWRLKPRTIIEIGSQAGGSALWLGDLLNNFEIEGHIYSIDLVKVESVSHPRVTFLQGNGRALGEALTADFLNGVPRPWLVIEDADHTYETSNAVLNFFHSWLQPEEYIIIEDGIVSDLAEDATCSSGPHRALKE